MFADWPTYVLVLCGVGAIVLQQLALRSGHLSAGLSAISVWHPGDEHDPRHHHLRGDVHDGPGIEWLWYGLGVALAVVGVTLLARSPAIAAATEPGSVEDPVSKTTATGIQNPVPGSVGGGEG